MARSEINLRYCSVAWTDDGAETTFHEDGSTVPATPHDTPHYHVISHRCGYGDDILAYCREHEFAHAFLEERLFNRPSPVLWALAHGHEVGPALAAREECLVQTFQAWLRAHQEPIIGGVDWRSLKDEALSLLETTQ